MSKYETLIKIIDELRNEAPGNFTRYHPKDNELDKLNQARSRAFIHLFLKGMYGLDKFQEREDYITDDPYDGGVDAYYIDASLKEIIFIQSKFRTNETNFETKEISYDELLAMDVDRILKGEELDERQNPYNSKIKTMQKKIQEIEDIARYSYKVVILANLKNTNDSNLRRLTGGLSSTIFDFEKCYSKLVFPIVSGCFFNADEIIIDLSLVNKEGNEGRIGYTVHTAMSDCKILVTYIPLIEIGKILYKYKNSVLKYNPRCFLGLKDNSVNRKIADTVKNKTTNEFALFNNGITILSDETSINSQVAKKDRAKLIIKNPQIINGGQTAVTLSSLYEGCKKNNDYTMFDDKEVLVKIITFINDQSRDDDNEIKQKKFELIENLSRATNEQSTVNEIDRRSNERILVDYQQYIYDDFGLFLNRKQGEFHEGLDKNYISKKQIIDLSNFMRIAVSINGNVKKARQSSDAVLFKEDNFKKYLNNLSDYKKYIYGYYCYQYLVELEKHENNYGMDKYGNALRYGKYAVINVVSRKFNKKIKISQYESNIKNITEKVLDRWITFENYIIEQQNNIDYFYKYQEDDNTKTIYNFDGYYKGKTINEDLISFDFEI